jgi:hypothetical protein
MYSEQLAVLLFIAATHAAGPGLANQPMAQMPRGGAERIGLQVKGAPRLISANKQRKQIKREREAMMLAEFR